VVEVNEEIVNMDRSVNMNLWALNEKMGSEASIKEYADINKAKR
jgi:hypothetical protein